MVLPLQALRLLAAGLGRVWFHGLRVRRRYLEAHLAAALPEQAPVVRRRLALRVCTAQVYGVLLLLGRWRWLRSPAMWRIEGEACLRAALDRGGVLVLGAHLGPYELALHHEARRGVELAVVSKRLHAQAVDAWWRRQRRGAGIRVLDADEGVMKQAQRLLRAGAAVAWVLDQHSPERRAVEAPFFGIPARSSAALATLAVRTGRPIVPCFCCWDERGRCVLRYGPAIDAPTEGDLRERIEATTRRCLALIEAAVRAHPEQWLWLHRRWKQADGRPLIQAEARRHEQTMRERRGA